MNLYEAELTIGDLSRRTGVGISTLRAWEARHGFPVPQRGPGGHRRYTQRDAEVVDEILEDRRNGSSLAAALARATARAGAPRQSVLAALRAMLPDVAPVRMSKRGMLAVSRAIEDEAASRVADAICVGAFQEERFWRQSEERWRDLAMRSRVTIALAAMPKRAQRGMVVEVPLDKSEPMAQEWVVCCDAAGFTACVAGVELPGGRRGPEGLRPFEALWTVEPVAVREAVRTAIALAAMRVPLVAERAAPRLAEPPGPGARSLRTATAVANRIIGELAPPGR